jgi:hypothetical protein
MVVDTVGVRPTRGFRVARLFWPVVLVVAALLGTGTAARGAPAAHFVPEASGAVWNGDVVTVTLREVGLQRDTVTTIAVEVTGTVDAVCRKADAVVVSSGASATVLDSTRHRTGDDGTVTATIQLALVVRTPVITGLDCTMSVTRALTVVLRDLDTGASLTFPGTVATPARYAGLEGAER